MPAAATVDAAADPPPAGATRGPVMPRATMPGTMVDQLDISLGAVIEDGHLRVGLFQFIQYAAAGRGHTCDRLARTYCRHDDCGTCNAEYSRQK